ADETGHAPRVHVERDVVEHLPGAVTLVEPADFEHEASSFVSTLGRGMPPRLRLTGDPRGLSARGAGVSKPGMRSLGFDTPPAAALNPRSLAVSIHRLRRHSTRGASRFRYTACGGTHPAVGE